MQWGFAKKDIWVDTEAGTVACDKEEVAKVQVSPQGTIDIEYGHTWAGWQDFITSPELKALTDAATTKLQSAGKAKGKGKSKGKDAPGR